MSHESRLYQVSFNKLLWSVNYASWGSRYNSTVPARHYQGNLTSTGSSTQCYCTFQRGNCLREKSHSRNDATTYEERGGEKKAVQYCTYKAAGNVPLCLSQVGYRNIRRNRSYHKPADLYGRKSTETRWIEDQCRIMFQYPPRSKTRPWNSLGLTFTWDLLNERPLAELDRWGSSPQRFHLCKWRQRRKRQHGSLWLSEHADRPHRTH